jgi:hypothetical protein
MAVLANRSTMEDQHRLRWIVSAVARVQIKTNNFEHQLSIFGKNKFE